MLYVITGISKFMFEQIVPWHGPEQLRFKLNLGKERLNENFTLDENLLLRMLKKMSALRKHPECPRESNTHGTSPEMQDPRWKQGGRDLRAYGLGVRLP